MARYINAHSSQYAEGNSLATRRSGCTWTSAANGINAATGGKRRPSPDAIHGVVLSREETSPATPGWSMRDLALAMQRMGVPFEDLSGTGWDRLLAVRATGRYIVLQGDSDRFANSTCSGAFDGDHAIGLHPNTRIDADGTIWWWIDDPICKTARWERDTVLRSYAEKLRASLYFGAFVNPVPKVAAPKPPAPPVTLRFAARKLAKPLTRTIRVPRATKARLRTAPRRTAHVSAQLPNGAKVAVYQVTDKGQSIGGSRRWYGNRSGSRWLHSSAF